MLLSSNALAQQAPATGTETGVQQLDEVVITTTRVQRNGFAAPTPVTVLGADQVAARGATNVADIINEIPSFRPTQTPQARAIGGGFGANFVDLRGLNQPVPGSATTARTLVLVDGRRHVPATTASEIDLNLIPSSLVERTEVVTGGASAEWGSDAIAGVVNLVMKTKLEGLQFNASAGGTDKHDDFSYNVNAAAGTAFAGGRGHIIAGAEYDSIGGVGNNTTARNWSSQMWGLVALPANRAAGLPANIVSPNVHYSDQLSAAGVITSGPLVNTTFLPNGSLAQFNVGSIVGGNQQIGGDNANLNFAAGLNIFNPVQRDSFLTHATFDLTSDIQLFAEAGYSAADQHALSAGRINQANLTIQIDNPFLPAALKQQMTALGLTSVPFGRFDSEIGRYRQHNYRDTENVVVGAKGSLPKGWSWDAYFQTGATRSIGDVLNMTSTPNYLAAINAVSVNGTIVCRTLVTARGTADPGCVPYNVFGVGAPSAAAQAYVQVDAKTSTFIHESVGAANLRGEPFSLPAGPVSVAAGGEWRLEAMSVNSDINQTLSRDDFGNTQPISGSYSVYEGYIAAVAPILKDVGFVHAIDLNAAVRETHYSLAGALTTWKYGATFEDATRQLRLRATSSRDVRAPNLQELFGAATSSTQNITDTVRAGSSSLVPILTSGSTKLQPEIADTLTYGGVLSPKFIPGLTGSLDYYNINIAGVISTLGGQNIVNRCALGATSLCALITRDPVSGAIIAIANNNLNLNQLKTSGLDIEVDYRLPISYIHLPGEMNVRALGNHVYTLTTVSVAGPQDYAGQQIPHWSWTFNINYALDKFSSNVTVRRVGQAIIDATKIGPDNPAYSPTLINSISRNVQPSIDYVDLQLQYTLKDSGSKRLVVYGVVNNVFDQAPPGYGGSNLTSASLYDLVGRFFRVGLRLSY